MKPLLSDQDSDFMFEDIELYSSARSNLKWALSDAAALPKNIKEHFMYTGGICGLITKKMVLMLLIPA